MATDVILEVSAQERTVQFLAKITAVQSWKCPKLHKYRLSSNSKMCNLDMEELTKHLRKFYLTKIPSI